MFFSTCIQFLSKGCMSHPRSDSCSWLALAPGQSKPIILGTELDSSVSGACLFSAVVAVWLVSVPDSPLGLFPMLCNISSVNDWLGMKSSSSLFIPSCFSLLCWGHSAFQLPMPQMWENKHRHLRCRKSGSRASNPYVGIWLLHAWRKKMKTAVPKSKWNFQFSSAG